MIATETPEEAVAAMVATWLRQRDGAPDPHTLSAGLLMLAATNEQDLALRDAFRKMRHFLMTTQGLNEDEAVSLMSVGVDFGVTQVVDGNWGVHAIVKKALFTGSES